MKKIETRQVIDVDDVEKAIRFYTKVFGLELGRRFDPEWVELLGGSAAIDLLEKRPGTFPYQGAEQGRQYGRHWTPVHLDFVVEDIEAAVERARSEGATLEGEIRTHPYGRLANLSDPFGHGFCFLEFRGKGYGELVPSG